MGSRPVPRPVVPVAAVLVSHRALTASSYDLKAVRRTLPEAVAWLANQRFAYLGDFRIEVWTEKGRQEMFGWDPSAKSLKPQ